MGSQYSGIDFSFLYVKDMNERDALSTLVTSDDNLPRMNVWVLQDAEKADLLKMILKPEHLEYTSALIVLDFDQPWEMMESLMRWTRVINDVMQSFMKDMPLNQRDLLKNRVSRHIKNFMFASENGGEAATEPKEEKKNKVKKEKDDSDSFNSDSDDDNGFNEQLLQDQLPLPEGVLKSNIGIPLIVACHKADLIGRGDKAQFLEQNIHFIQRHLRQTCLFFGASLIFTDIHSQTNNIETLYKYILHRIYDQDFNVKAEPNQKNQIFIPSGFDSLQFIESLLTNNLEGKVFEEVIKKPSTTQNAQQKIKPEILTDEWQQILYKYS